MSELSAKFRKTDQRFILKRLYDYLFKPSKKQRKKQIKIGGGALAVLLLWQGYSWLFSPFVGGMDYGMCRVFLELNVRYPDSLRLSHVQNFGQSVRIWYTQLDSFGQYRMESIQCYYRPDPVTGAAFERVTINRREVDPDIVERFNISIPAVLAYPPDLTYPRDFPNKIQDLQKQR